MLSRKLLSLYFMEARPDQGFYCKSAHKVIRVSVVAFKLLVEK